MSQAGGGEVYEPEECGDGDGGVSGAGEVSEMSGFPQMARIKEILNELIHGYNQGRMAILCYCG